MITPKLKKSVWVVLTAAALTACGGSSSGSDTPAPVAEVTQATTVSQYAAKYDDQINQFTCFKGENRDKCGLILYQVMVEAAPNGGGDDAAGKGTGWGPSEHKGTLRGIENSLDFIKGSGANALWITPVFTSSKEFGDEKTNATGYFASEYWDNVNDKPSIDPDFGGLRAFESLVSKTHNTLDDVDGKGMWFILDGVFGHASAVFNSTLNYPPVMSDNCLTMSGDKKSKTDKEVYGSAGSNFKCFNWDESNTKNFFVGLAEKMITEYHIDGWRLDQAYQVPLEEGWKSLKQEVMQASTEAGRLGYMVAEVWSGDPQKIQDTVFKDAAVESAFNFPLRFKLVQTIAGQEETKDSWATLQPASGLADEYGYGSYDIYKDYNVMPNMFTDNMEYSGPITIYYGSEYGDWTEGFSKKLDPCGTGKEWCDDHASRTQMVSSEDKLKQWQKDLRTNVGRMMTYRKAHPALYNGKRFHIYSTEEKPSDRDSENFYVDVKKAADDSEAFVFVASMSKKERTLQFEGGLIKYLCQKAKGADSCDLDLVMDTSKPEVMSPGSEPPSDSPFAFKMPALSAKLYIVK